MKVCLAVGVSLAAGLAGGLLAAEIFRRLPAAAGRSAMAEEVALPLSISAFGSEG